MFIVDERVLKRTLIMSLAGTRGGPVRLKILLHIEKTPCNINELSKELSLDYKTIQHHVRVLQKSGFLRSGDDSYGKKYTLSPILEKNKNILESVSNMGKSK